MAKIRVHELSKQLNISNKDIIDTLGAKGIEIKSHCLLYTSPSPRDTR